jgi:transcriptional regulator GlxA family with amidase domain
VRERTGCGPKRFIELFTQAIGMTPDRYRRLMRSERALKLTSANGAAPDWAWNATDGCFTGQAHLTQEFRSFSGIAQGACQSVSPG